MSPRERFHFVLVALMLAVALPSFSQQPSEGSKQVKVLKFKKGVIKTGMVSDAFIKVVTPKDVIDQVANPDPLNPNSLLVRKHCKLEGKEFTVLLARQPDPGPYRVISILTK